MIALETNRLTASLPKGYRARPFETATAIPSDGLRKRADDRRRVRRRARRRDDRGLDHHRKARDYRGRGVAIAIKSEALPRAKAKGMRAMFTTNDEPNKVVREINAKLGYQLLPAHVELEKPLLH